MKAIVQDRYGRAEHVLRLAEVEAPALPDDAVLVRVHASSINSGDWRRVYAEPALIRLSEGIRRPRNPLLGVDCAGIVEQVGPRVSGLAVGDEVYGMRSGAWAEYVAGRSFVRKPANLSLEQAAAVPAAGVTALQALRDHGRLQTGERVLVNGAGGGVGTWGVLLARALGAAEVTAVTRTEHLEMVGALGATEVIDYTREDFSRRDRRYDLVVDCGGRPSVAAFRRVLAPGGRIVLVAAGKGRLGVVGRLVGSQLRNRLLRQPVLNFIVRGPFDENLRTLAGLIEAGGIQPVIDRTVPLAEVSQAVAYARSERVGGKIVITI